LKKENPNDSSRVSRVLLVEDMGMFRAFLEKWVASVPGFLLAGSAGSGEAALALLEAARPDVLIVDLQLPGMGGLDFVRAARQVRPQVRALVLSSLIDPLTLTRVRESGVEGYMEKDAPPARLLEALVAVAAGRRFYSDRFSEILARESANPHALGKILSRREQEVLTHVLAGRSSREIGDLLGLSARTIEFHRANLMAKLGATNVTELVTNARQRGMAG
jgi:DNA-binding NarL/FixJ family response regulator